MSTLLEKSRLHKRQGFTLIETVVSLLLLSLAITPALILSNSAVNIATEVQNNLTATGLTQEGIEVVRAIRDTNWFSGNAFDTGLADGTYRLEWNSTSLLALGGNPVLNVNNGQYTYTGGTPSLFTRTVTISHVSAAELKVISQVSWPARGGARTVQAEEHLFNWR